MNATNADVELFDELLNEPNKHWPRFVDRFGGIVMQVAKTTLETQGWNPETASVEDLTTFVFEQLVADDFAILRKFECRSQLSTFVTIAARRLMIQRLQKLDQQARLTEAIRSENQAKLEVPGSNQSAA